MFFLAEKCAKSAKMRKKRYQTARKLTDLKKTGVENGER
jgi:hypothetical protein